MKARLLTSSGSHPGLLSVGSSHSTSGGRSNNNMNQQSSARPSPNSSNHQLPPSLARPSPRPSTGNQHNQQVSNYNQQSTTATI